MNAPTMVINILSAAPPFAAPATTPPDFPSVARMAQAADIANNNVDKDSVVSREGLTLSA